MDYRGRSTTPTTTAYSRDAILAWVDTHRPDIVGLAQALVHIPSENKQPHGSEKACQMFVAEFMRGLGCRVDVFTPLEVAGLTGHPTYWPGRSLKMQRAQGRIDQRPSSSHGGIACDP